jgi:hypothetical protein
LLLAAGGALPADAQVVRGTVRTQQTEVAVPQARVIARDSADQLLAETVSDANGRFTLVIPRAALFKVGVLKVGWLQSWSDLIRAAPTDTLEVTLDVPADPVALDTVSVRARVLRSQNTIAYEEAKRRGWKVYEPTLIERHRDNARDFVDLMREVGATGLNLSSRDCIRSLRYNRCLVYVIDGMPAGPSLFVPPRDVYFFAVLTASESASQWGDKAPWGAIVIYTRMYGDNRRP